MINDDIHRIILIAINFICCIFAGIFALPRVRREMKKFANGYRQIQWASIIMLNSLFWISFWSMVYHILVLTDVVVNRPIILSYAIALCVVVGLGAWWFTIFYFEPPEL